MSTEESLADIFKVSLYDAITLNSHIFKYEGLFQNDFHKVVVLIDPLSLSENINHSFTYK